VNISEKKSKIVIIIKDQSDVLCSNEKDVLDTWRQYFKSFWTCSYFHIIQHAGVILVGGKQHYCSV